jgi:lipoprotein-anchoring transpeptidase ErfK/SrfK
MRRVLAFVSGLALAAGGAFAANADPYVIGAPNAASRPAPAPAPARSGGGLGGGFIEFLVTAAGGSGAPQPSAPVAAPPQRMASIGAAPAAEPEAGTPAEFQRQEVDYDGREKPGTIVVDTPRKFLFLVEPNGRAMRYGIGVGRPGFEWSGVKTITRKAEWPDWTPPPEMMLRRPDLPPHMDGGEGNPLGARALYLGSSMYRIHGTNEPETIGRNVSSGCIRMMNADVIDLYNRVPVGTRVIVM